MADDDHLFPLPDVPAAAPGLSSGARRTLRQKAQLENGTHPVTGRDTWPHGTCGTCAHLLTTGESHRRYFKCGLVANTAGPGTDIRKSWPACHRYDPESETP